MLIREVRSSGLGDTSGVDGLSSPSSIDWTSTSRASYLLYRGTWEGKVGKEGVRLPPRAWTCLHSLFSFELLPSAQCRGIEDPLDPQDTISLLCGKGTLLVHVQLGVCHDPQVLLCRATFQLGVPQHILEHGIVPPQVQDFALSLDELHEVPVSPFLQPVQVPLDVSTTLWCVSHSSQLCAISILAEDALCSIIQIINEYVEQDWTQY
ncbi:hypothetical protein QYF61_010983 [Mycteria americana]|uniref:Uncharacterized protein n=1 Tax=Mycteria americana TaxID=33587 RepID=A0AAN7S371_MYCAM|nr:hypothetical protein QYF61_010983 [Mycteria americana]